MGCCQSKNADATTNPVANNNNSKQPLSNAESQSSSSSIEAAPAGDIQWACFGAGCYWGTEKFFRYDFTRKHMDLGSIITGQVGFMGPESAPKNPTYREVCSGSTGHVEVYNFQFKGGNTYYEYLVRYFFQFHDPTTLNRQGNDKGTQYASVIYCYHKEQFDTATKVKKELQELINQGKIKGFQGTEVSTDIRMATKFYPAHDEHQDYLNVNPDGYCNHRIRFKEWPTA